MYLKCLLEELCQVSYSAIPVNCDNQGAIALSKNPTHHNRSKHIDIKYHFCRESVSSGKVEVIYVPTEDNFADVMTEAVSKPKHAKFCDILFGVMS